MKPTPQRKKATSAAVIYILILMGFQIFLVSVAVEAFQTNKPGLAWATAVVSVILAGLAAVFLRFFRP